MHLLLLLIATIPRLLSVEAFLIDKRMGQSAAAGNAASASAVLGVQRMPGRSDGRIFKKRAEKIRAATATRPVRRSSKLSAVPDRINALVVQSGCITSWTGALLVLWSEGSILFTSCGPVQLTDAVERFSYLLVITSSSIFWFARIVTGGRGLAETALTGNNNNNNNRDLMFLVPWIQWTERINYVAVAGAFLALAAQYERQTNMTGLTGINQDYCRALQTIEAMIEGSI